MGQTNDPPTRKSIDSPAGMDREVGLLFAQLELVRKETRSAIDGMPNAYLDVALPGYENTISQLLYHIAGVELFWLQVVVLGAVTLAEANAELKPARLGTAESRALAGRPFEFYAAKLDEVRAKTEAAFWKLKDEALDTDCKIPLNDGTRATPRWAITHLMEHEAHHRGQIALLRKWLASREST